jgi:hypothetical protein
MEPTNKGPRTMSHFYGTIDGKAKNQATQCGSKNSGITTHAAGWGGAVQVRVWHDFDLGCDRFEVRQTTWKGAGCDELIAAGVLGTPTTLPDGRPPVPASYKRTTQELEL